MASARHQWRSTALGVAAVAGVVCIAVYAPAESRNEAYTTLASIVSVVVMRHALDSSYNQSGQKPKDEK
jgi:hypothetical protein